MDVPGGSGWHEASMLMRIYASGFCGGLSALRFHVRPRAYRLRGQLRLNPVEVLQTRSGIAWKNAVPALVGTVSFLVALKSPGGQDGYTWRSGRCFGSRARSRETHSWLRAASPP